MHVGGVTTSNAVVTFNGYDCKKPMTPHWAAWRLSEMQESMLLPPRSSWKVEDMLSSPKGLKIQSLGAARYAPKQTERCDRKMGRGKYWLIASRRSKDETALNDSQGKQLIFIFHKSQMGRNKIILCLVAQKHADGKTRGARVAAEVCGQVEQYLQLVRVRTSCGWR